MRVCLFWLSRPFLWGCLPVYWDFVGQWSDPYIIDCYVDLHPTGACSAHFCLRSPWVLAMIVGRVDKQHFSLASCANLAPLCGRVFRLSSTASVLMIFLCSQWLFTHPMVGCMPFSLVGKFVIFAGYLSFGGRLHSHSSTTLYYMYLFTLVCWVIH